MLYIILMCVSRFIFFANKSPMTYYLLFISYLFQTMEMTLDKKQTRVIFLFEFKMGRKAAETTCNINSAFAPGTANDSTVQSWVKKFCKGDDSLEDDKDSGWPLETDNNQLRAILKWILLQ